MNLAQFAHYNEHVERWPNVREHCKATGVEPSVCVRPFDLDHPMPRTIFPMNITTCGVTTKTLTCVSIKVTTPVFFDLTCCKYTWDIFAGNLRKCHFSVYIFSPLTHTTSGVILSLKKGAYHMEELELKDAIDALEGRDWEYLHLLPSEPVADFKNIIYGLNGLRNIIECSPVFMRLLRESLRPAWRTSVPPSDPALLFCGQHLVINKDLDPLTVRVSR